MNCNLFYAQLRYGKPTFANKNGVFSVMRAQITMRTQVFCPNFENWCPEKQLSYINQQNEANCVSFRCQTYLGQEIQLHATGLFAIFIVFDMQWLQQHVWTAVFISRPDFVDSWTTIFIHIRAKRLQTLYFCALTAHNVKALVLWIQFRQEDNFEQTHW